MFEVALEDDCKFGVESNPARGVKVRGQVGEARTRRHFTIDELSALFASPVYTEGERPTGGGGEAAYWLPLLGLYTGARLRDRTATVQRRADKGRN